MKLEKYKLLHEDDDCFVLAEGDNHLRIAKRGLGPNITGKLRQHFAHGGRVAGDGGETRELAAGYAEGGIVPTMTGLAPVSTPEDEAMLAILAKPQVGSHDSTLRSTMPPAQSFTSSAPVDPAQASQLATQTAASPVPEVQPTKGFLDPAPQAAPPPAVAASAPQLPSFGAPGVGNAMGEIKQATDAMEEGYKALAVLEANKAADDAAKMAEAEKVRQEIVANYAKQHQAWQARGDALHNSIMNHEIDPHRMLGSASSKISAGIAIMLGSIGAALQGSTENQALRIIDNALNRDLDAQKAELGKKQNLLSYHLQQGHDMQTARALALADLKDMVAGQIASVAPKYASDKTLLTAQVNINKFKADATAHRVNVAGQLTDAAIKRNHLGLLQAQAERERLINAGLASGKLSPEMLDPKLAERVVTLPSGERVAAPNADEAKKVRDALVERENFMSMVNEAREHRKSKGRAWGPQESAEAEALQKRMVVSLGRMFELGALAKDDLKIVEAQVANVGKIFSQDSTTYALLDGLEKMTNDKVTANIRVRLGKTGSGPPTSAGGFRKAGE